jgi:hypothetical protein
MEFDLTGQKVSLSYGNLIQHIDGSFYDGLGNPIIISVSEGVSQSYVDNADNIIKSTYIPDISLNHDQFIWNSGTLDISVSGGGGVTQSYVDNADNNIRAKYIPDASLNQSHFSWNSGILDVSVVSSFDFLDGGLNWGIPMENLFLGGSY